jgi:predicted nuclease of predicted toxin-antitoxin system
LNALFDANMPYDLAWALRRLGKSVVHVVDIEELGSGAPDHQIVQYAASRGLVVVTRDHAMKRTHGFKADVVRLKAGIFLVNTGSARQLRAWEIAKLMFRAWDHMEAFVEEHGVPFVALVKHNGRVVTFH